MKRKKKAGADRHPATTTRRQQTYTTYRRMSSPFLRKHHPDRRDRRFPRKADQIALGLLVLGLQQPDLPARDRRRGWALAERWLIDLVETRLRGATL